MQQKVILFYNPTLDMTAKGVKSVDFKKCEVKKCEMTFNIKDSNRSDAVIIHHKKIKGPDFSLFRPHGQIWIMIQQEAPVYYGKMHNKMFQVRYFIYIYYTRLHNR